MAKNTKQIALIQHRRGKQSELPYQLNEGEIALATDTNNVFIGNPNHPLLQDRAKADEPIFPYGNVQILTEFTDNMNTIEYSFDYNSEYAKFPIILMGSVLNPTIPATSSILINNQEIIFEGSGNIELSNIINTINEKNINVKAQNNNGYIQLITLENKLTLQDGIVVDGQKTALESLGLARGDNESTSPHKRTLQSVLDDRLSIKSFDVYGNNQNDDAYNINSAIMSIFGGNRQGKELYFPSGQYLINSNSSINLITNTHIVGEGIGKTIIKSTQNNVPLLLCGDSNFNSSSSSNYLINGSEPYNIYIENMTFDISTSTISTLFMVGSSHNIIFNNVEFIGSTSSKIIDIISNATVNNITFNQCYFIGKETHNLQNAIVVNGIINGLNINSCLFKNIDNEAIIIKSNDMLNQTNAIISNNKFENCGNISQSIISLGSNTSYINVANNLFEKDVIELNTNIKPITNNSTLNRIDILNKKEDNRKIYKFSFNQPSWDYLDYLINPNGEYIIETLNDDNQEITNYLQIKAGNSSNNNTFNIDSSKIDGNLKISSGYYGNVILGQSDLKYNTWEESHNYNQGDIIEYDNNGQLALYESKSSHLSDLNNAPTSDTSEWNFIKNVNPEILMYKNINMNGQSIKDTTNNISFKCTNDNILIIDDSESSVEYSNRVANYENGIPNVKYVLNMINQNIQETFDFQKLSIINNSQYQMFNFDKDLYGNEIYFNSATFSVRRPFYPIISLLNDTPLEWKTGLKYYIGEIFTHTDTEGTYYYVCTNDHIATDWDTDFITNKLWSEVSLKGTDAESNLEINLPDVKYVSIYATNDTNHKLLFNNKIIDISNANNMNQYYSEINFGSQYNVNTIVSCKNRYWKCIQTNTPNDYYDLHNESNWICLFNNGFNYKFDFERTLYNIDLLTKELSVDNTFYNKFNFAGYKIYIEFYDENGNLLPVIKNEYSETDASKIQINPSGVLNVDINYVRGFNNEN